MPNTKAIDDSASAQKIISLGTIEAIKEVMESKSITTDQKVWNIRNIIDIYDRYFQTGRIV